jgi:hypothetical protein
MIGGVTIRAGIYELGPDTASLVVKTYREGAGRQGGPRPDHRGEAVGADA